MDGGAALHSELGVPAKGQAVRAVQVQLTLSAVVLSEVVVSQASNVQPVQDCCIMCSPWSPRLCTSHHSTAQKSSAAQRPSARPQSTATQPTHARPAHSLVEDEVQAYALSATLPQAAHQQLLAFIAHANLEGGLGARLCLVAQACLQQKAPCDSVQASQPASRLLLM